MADSSSVSGRYLGRLFSALTGGGLVGLAKNLVKAAGEKDVVKRIYGAHLNDGCMARGPECADIDIGNKVVFKLYKTPKDELRNGKKGQPLALKLGDKTVYGDFKTVATHLREVFEGPEFN